MTTRWCGPWRAGGSPDGSPGSCSEDCETPDVFSQEMIDLMCDTPGKHRLIHVGGGFIVIYGPDGARVGDKLAPDQERIVYPDIDLAMIRVAKAAADPAGHCARPTLPGFCSTIFSRIDRHSGSDRQKNRRVCVLTTFRRKIREPKFLAESTHFLRDRLSRTGVYNSF